MIGRFTKVHIFPQQFIFSNLVLPTTYLAFELYSEGKFKDVTFGGQRSAHICPCNCYLRKCSQSTSSSWSPSPWQWPSSPWPLQFPSLIQLDFNSWPQDREEQGAQGKAHQGRSWLGPAWRTARSEAGPEQDCFLLWLAALRAIETALFTQALALNCCKHWHRTFHWEYAAPPPLGGFESYATKDSFEKWRSVRSSLHISPKTLRISK